MKIRQGNLRVFEFEQGSCDEMLECIKTNFDIMQHYCLAFRGGIPGAVRDFLLERNVNFLELNRDIKGVKDEAVDISGLFGDSRKKFIEPVKTTIFSRQIRSGEEIKTCGDTFFLKDVHNGASVVCGGNLHVFGKCEANLEVLGDFIMIREFCNGRISLQGYSVDQELLGKFTTGSLKHIYLQDGSVRVDTF